MDNLAKLDDNVWAPDPLYDPNKGTTMSSSSLTSAVDCGDRTKSVNNDVYKCKKCRRDLFFSSSLLFHNKGYFEFFSLVFFLDKALKFSKKFGAMSIVTEKTIKYLN